MPHKPDDTDERALVERAAGGDPRAQADLYRRHAGAVYTLAMRMLCHPQMAEEAMQDTFVKAFGKLADFRGEAAFGTWLRRVAANECLQALRSPWRRRARPWVEVEATPDRTGERIDLDRALAALDPVTRAVIWLHDVEGFTHKDIATAMGRTVSFSKSRLARGHRQLRDQLNAKEQAASCMPVLSNS